MLLEIDGKRYPLITAEEATLADLLAIRRQTGTGVGELQELLERFDGLTPKEIEAMAEEDADVIDDSLLAYGISVWLSRRHAGEDLTLEQACAVPLDAIRQIAEPGDHVEGAATPAAKKSAKKKTTADPR